MQFDRTISISAANSRKSVSWQPQALLWSEFIGKLTVPARSPETVAAYLAMRKAQQDELKDVGGFVGGKINSFIIFCYAIVIIIKFFIFFSILFKLF